MGKKISYYDNFQNQNFKSFYKKGLNLYIMKLLESEESRSGIGSEIENKSFKSLEHFIKEFKIKSIIDIPCGDLTGCHQWI